MSNCNCKNFSQGTNCQGTTAIQYAATGLRGLTGADGADGSSGIIILENTIGTDYGNVVSLAEQSLVTYNVDNTPTPVLDTNGEFIDIEAYFYVKSQAFPNTRDLLIKAGSTTLVSCSAFLDAETICMFINSSNESSKRS